MVNSTGCDVDRQVFGGAREAQDAFDEVVDIAEAAGLISFAVDGELLAAQGLHHEVGDDAAVAGVQAGP